MSVLDLLNFGGAKRTPIIRQSEASECGVACLAMVAGFYGLEADMTTFRRQFSISLRGANLKSLMEVADHMGLGSRALRLELEEIEQVKLPAILHWDLNHFVVLTRVQQTLRGKRFHVNDPSKGSVVMSENEVSRLFTGVALEVSRTTRFRPQIAKSGLKIRQLWSSVHGLGNALAGVLTLSAILQLITLIMPFYLQLAIDSVLPAADIELLQMLALGFGGLVAISTVTGWMRSITLLNMTSSFSFQIVNNLYRHLVSLPLSWFEKRHVGDVVSRFGSTQAISDFVSRGVVSAVLDGLMAFVTLFLMFVYSPTLAGVALAVWVLYVMLRVSSFTMMQQSNVSSITANARENSAFIETMRGISTVKAFGKEAARQRSWQGLKATAINAQLKLGRISAGFDATSGFIMAAERVIFVYLAVGMALKGGLTVGMIFAFQAYKGQFLDAATRLVDQALQYRLIDVHLGRIADIALSSPETAGSHFKRARSGGGRIELQNVSFRYGLADDWVLRNVNLRIEAGEMVALVGPSGGGKTTLLKLMMGLLEPTVGSILIDDQPISRLGLRAWRSEIGSVLQDDQLFAGSLAENIAFFDPEIDIGRVRDACRRAAVLEEIEAMPLGLETLVGDMGSSLSGGQRQRVMLARALYAEPTALFMDEGTANLDPASEAAVVDTMRQMRITRVVSAHRPLAIVASTRILLVRAGGVGSVEKQPAAVANEPSVTL